MNADEMAAKDLAKLTMGNKMAVLGGDLLLANASVALAKLHNAFIVNEIAKSISDMTVALFVRDDEDITTVKRWEQQVYFGE